MVAERFRETASTRAEPETQRALWTRAQYHAMGEMGWFQNRRVELLAGEIIEMSPVGDRHWLCTNLATEALRAAFGAGFVISTQSALRLSESSEPEPDLAIVRGDLRHMTAIPDFAELVVEVSDTTSARDLAQKADLYAAARIPEYWIINLPERKLEVRRDPHEKSDAPFGHAYLLVRVLAKSESVAPLAAENSQVKVADLLP